MAVVLLTGDHHSRDLRRAAVPPQSSFSRRITTFCPTADHRRHRSRRCRPLAFPRNSLRPRLRVSRELVDGSACPVETRDYLPPLGCARPLRLWRGSVHILSANFMASRRAARRIAAMETGSRCIRICGSHALRMLNVPACAPLPRPPGRDFRGRSVCCQPLLPCHCLLAQRLRCVAGWSAPAPSSAANLRAAGYAAPRCDPARASRGRSLVNQRAFGCDDQLFVGVPNRGGRDSAAFTSSITLWGGGRYPRSWSRWFLHCSRCV